MIFEDLDKKVAVVTGASDGIGKATVQSLLNQNVKVFGIDHNDETINHDNYVHALCELQSVEEIEKTFNFIRNQTKSVDYLVNVAGIDPKITIEESNENSWNQIVNLNLRGYYFCIKSSLDMLRKGYGKSIVNISSINFRLGVPGRSIYSSTKAGIIGLTTGLARELGKDGIRINCISPGWVFTERQKKEYFETDEKEKHLQKLFTMQALKIQISPEDIANHVLFLLSNYSRATTGHNLIVDGGWILE